MSLTYESTKRRRVYTRKFDHDLCRTLWSHGIWTQQGLADFFGVTVTRVRQVLIPEYGELCTRRAQEKGRALHHHCPQCDAPITCSDVYQGRYRGVDVELCGKCRVRNAASTVRPDTLRCHLCQQWLPDDQFPSRKDAHARRGRHGQCQLCNSESKRLWRQSRTPEQKAADAERGRLRRRRARAASS